MGNGTKRNFLSEWKYVAFAICFLFGSCTYFGSTCLMISGQDVVVSQLQYVYKKYMLEIEYLHDLSRKYCKRPGMYCLSDDYELEISYMRIRETRPKVIWEISPSHGYSTLWIMEALKANKNNGKLYSFDIHDAVVSASSKSWEKYGWNFVLGDFKEQFLSNFKKYPTPDYLFLDSLHNEEFARFYTTSLFPKILEVKRSVYVSLHDVYNPSFWADGPRSELRKEAKLPEWLPNEEGQVVLDWMVYNQHHVSGVYTVAEAHNKTVSDIVKKVRDNTFTSRLSTHGSANPTLFFTLKA